MAEQNNDEKLTAIAPAFRRALAKRYPVTEQQKAFFERAFAERMQQDNDGGADSSKKRERDRQQQSTTQSQKQKQTP